MASTSETVSSSSAGPLTTETKVARAEALKGEGNDLVKQKKYKKAIVKYSQVLPPPSPQTLQRLLYACLY